MNHIAPQPPETPAVSNQLLTLPNALSVARMALGVAFPFLPDTWRAPVIVIAAVTDLLDGALSRYLGMGSRAGRVLDPIADKTFVAGVIVTFLAEGLLTWAGFLLVAARDLAVLVGAAVGLATRHWSAFTTISPSFLGKATTAAQFAFFLTLVLEPPLEPPLLFALFLLTTGLSLAAALQYVELFFRVRKSI